MIRVASALTAALALLAPTQAHADFRVISPYEINLGEIAIEHNGDAVFDRRPGQRSAASYTTELGTGLTSWWQSEIELGFDREPGDNQPTLLTQAVTQNTFQLTEPGEGLLGSGFYFEYGQSLTRGRAAGSNQMTFGPVVAKEIGRTVHTLDLFLTRQLGPDQTTPGLDVSYAWQSRWNIWAPLSPAIEIYGNAGTVSTSPNLMRQQLLAGPVGIGLLKLDQLGLGDSGNLAYEVGWLFGVTRASASGTLRWRLEIELPF